MNRKLAAAGLAAIILVAAVVAGMILFSPDRSEQYNIDRAANLAIVNHLKGNLDRALDLFLRSLLMVEYTKGPTSQEAGKVLLNLSNLYRDRGDQEKAKEAEEKAMAILDPEKK